MRSTDGWPHWAGSRRERPRRGDELARLIERSSELKRALVDFACSPRLERSLAAAVSEAGLDERAEADAIGTIDRFASSLPLPESQGREPGVGRARGA